jgi:hypothetical protein
MVATPTKVPSGKVATTTKVETSTVDTKVVTTTLAMAVEIFSRKRAASTRLVATPRATISSMVDSSSNRSALITTILPTTLAEAGWAPTKISMTQKLRVGFPTKISLTSAASRAQTPNSSKSK